MTMVHAKCMPKIISYAHCSTDDKSTTDAENNYTHSKADTKFVLYGETSLTQG